MLSFAITARHHADVPNVYLGEEEAATLLLQHQTFSFNCFYIGITGCMLMLGVCTVMFIRYLAGAFSRDTIWIKIWAVTTVLQLFGVSSYNIFFQHLVFIKDYGYFEQFMSTRKYGWFSLQNALIMAECLSYFAYRAFRLNGNNWILLGVLLALILVGLGAGITVPVLFRRYANWYYAVHRIKTWQVVWLSTAVAANLTITAAMLYPIWKSWKKIESKVKILPAVIRVMLESQMPSGIVTFIFLVQYCVDPSSFFNVLCLSIQPHVYTVGLIYALNSRMHRKKGPTMITMSSVGGETFQLTHRQAATIMVDVETETYETRLDRNAQGSRMPETKMERLQEEEWDSDDKTVAFGSVNSTFNAKIEPPTPPSEPPAGPGVTPRPHAE